MGQEEYTQYDEHMDVPREVGVEGFIKAIREILKLPRVNNIVINSKGGIDYTFFMRRGEEKRTITMNFQTLMPMALAQNTRIEEVEQAMTPGIAFSQLFHRAALDHLIPIAFIVGSNSPVWEWLQLHGMRPPSASTIFGLPVHTDRMCPDETLLLATAFKRDAELVEMHKAYKIFIPVGPST